MCCFLCVCLVSLSFFPRLADLAGAALLASLVDNYQAVEKALGVLGLTTQMVMYVKGKHNTLNINTAEIEID